MAGWPIAVLRFFPVQKGLVRNGLFLNELGLLSQAGGD